MSSTIGYVNDLMDIEKEFAGVSFANISKDPFLPVYQANFGSIFFTCIPASCIQSKNQYFLGGKYSTKTCGYDSKGKFIEAAYELIKKSYVDLKLFNKYQIEQIVMGIEAGVPIHMYSKPELSEDQMELLREGLALGLPVQHYNSADFSFEQMHQIQQGFKEKIDVSFYLSPLFDANQMAEIREGLKEGLEVSFYANTAFDYFQMRVIKTGLQKGLDVRQYANPECDLGEMAKIYNRLLRESRSIDQMIQGASNSRTDLKNNDMHKMEQKKELEMSM